MSHNKDQHVDLYAILPFAKFKAMDQKVKKTESMPEPASTLHPPDNPSPKSEPEPLTPQEGTTLQNEAPKVELKTKYRGSQLKKLIDRMGGSKGILRLDNLDELITSALSTTRKTLPNEEAFFQFLFENNLGHFVKNRNKINLYYQGKDSWFHL